MVAIIAPQNSGANQHDRNGRPCQRAKVVFAASGAACRIERQPGRKTRQFVGSLALQSSQRFRPAGG
jgi:hypothetical protein